MKCSGDSIQVIVKAIGVYVQRHRGRRVAEHPLHCFDVRSRRDREACRGVPEVVNRQLGRHARALLCIDEPALALSGRRWWTNPPPSANALLGFPGASHIVVSLPAGVLVVVDEVGAIVGDQLFRQEP